MLLFWITAIITLGLDLLSKELVFSALTPTPNQSLIIIDNWVYFSLHINRGAVWGIAGDSPYILMGITAIIIPIVLYLAYSYKDKKLSILPRFGFGLLLGGALGNLYDRIFTDIKLLSYPESYQGVRDFIDIQVPGVYNWPVFNIADIAIVAGVIIYAVWSLLPANNPKKN